MLALAALLLATQTTAVEAPTPDAPAAPSALSDSADFIEGRRLYDSFEFEKASFRFRAATRLELPDADRARAFVWLGVALGQAGDEPSAREAFATALALDPAAALPPDVPPTLGPTFDAARNAPPSAPAPNPVATAGSESAPTGPPVLALVGAGVAGAGVVVGLLGAGLGALSLAQADEALGEKYQDDAIEKYQAAQATALGANVLIGIGGAALVAGAAVAVASAFIAE